MKLTAQFKLRNITPGAVRYQEIDKNGAALKPATGATIGTLYIRKSAFALANELPPDEFTLIISTEAEAG